MWHILMSTFKVKWSKVKVTVLKCRLIAKLLLSFRKSGSPNLMAMLEFSSEAWNVVSAHAQYKFGQKQPTTTGVTSCGLQVAMHSQLYHIF